MAEQVSRGLEGVVIGETRTSLVDGIAGKLSYGGYCIEDLAAHATFEEVVFPALAQSPAGRRGAGSAASRDRAERGGAKAHAGAAVRIPAGCRPHVSAGGGRGRAGLP